MEGSRTGWLFDLLHLIPDRSRYRQAIIDAFVIASDESDLDVMAGLLMRFADAGDTNAGDILRESLDHLPPGVLDTVGFRFVQLYGLPALPALIMRLDDAGGNWLRAQAEEEFGVDAVAAVLAASTDPRVIAFDERTRRRENRVPEAPSRLSLDEFVAELDAAPDRIRSLALRFAAGAELGELVRVIELIEAGHRHVAGLLRIGARIPLPRMPANLIALAESPDADIADAAIDALVHFPGPETLAVGRRLFDAGNWGAVELLAGATAEEIRALPARLAGITDAETDASDRHGRARHDEGTKEFRAMDAGLDGGGHALQLLPAQCRAATGRGERDSSWYDRGVAVRLQR